jgi:hypothetical protein
VVVLATALGAVADRLLVHLPQGHRRGDDSGCCWCSHERWLMLCGGTLLAGVVGGIGKFTLVTVAGAVVAVGRCSLHKGLRRSRR